MFYFIGIVTQLYNELALLQFQLSSKFFRNVFRLYVGS